MTNRIIILLFIYAIYANIVSAINIYDGDKKRYLNNVFGKMLEFKVNKFLLKYNCKTTQIYLRTFIANILLFTSILLEILLFVFSLLVNYDTHKIILGSTLFILSLLIGNIITCICRYKLKKN